MLTVDHYEIIRRKVRDGRGAKPGINNKTKRQAQEIGIRSQMNAVLDSYFSKEARNWRFGVNNRGFVKKDV